MPVPTRTVRSDAPSPPPAAPAEHISMGSEESDAPAVAAKTPRASAVLRNSLRRSAVELTLFEEGYLKVTALRNGEAGVPFFLDLKFLDPIPRIERVVAVRSLAASAGSIAIAALAAFLLRFELLRTAAAWTLGGAALVAAAALYAGLCLSHEATEFCTLHGRARVLRLVANLGSVRRFRAFVPKLSHAIEAAAERIGADTAAYLRAEMREHYRLRGEGVLGDGECTAGTGRILAQFDLRL